MPRQLISDALNALPKSASEPLRDFLRVFYDQAQKQDLQAMDPIGMAQVAQTHWDMARTRQGSEPMIRISTPALDGGDWTINRTVIDLVNDDMAFLVDSVAAELARHNLVIHILIHPILHIGPNAETVFDEPGENTRRFSHIHIQLTSAIPPQLAREIESALLGVIEDVRVSTRDWRSMRSILQTTRQALANAPHGEVSAEDSAEYLEFLDYLYQDNFTFLGYRRYAFSDGPNGDVVSTIVPGSSLGLLADEHKPAWLSAHPLPQPLQRLRRDLPPVTISKLNVKSTVHRPVHMDAIAVKLFDDKGHPAGEALFIGLFTSVTYSRSVRSIPYLRRKAEAVISRADVEEHSHDYKALRHILEKYPRDELFQIEPDLLYTYCQEILRLQERQRIALFTRRDPFGRYVSCLVYIPREKYGSRLRAGIQAILERELDGWCSDTYTTLDDSPMARVLMTIDVDQSNPPHVDNAALEALLIEAGRSWKERLTDAMRAQNVDEEQVIRLSHLYGWAFPIAYTEVYRETQALHDIAQIEQVLATGRPEMDLYRPEETPAHQIRLKLFQKGSPVPLSGILPVLEQLGLQVISEMPFAVRPAGCDTVVWVQDFLAELRHGTGDERNIPVAEVKTQFEDALDRVWLCDLESEALNGLVLTARLGWRDITILRAYIRYLRQTSFPFSASYMEESVAAHPRIARLIVELFHALHDPVGDTSGALAAGAAAAIDRALESVTLLDHDRIFRTLVAAINATLRTNFFQTGDDGEPKPYLSFKLDSSKTPELPDPRPFREIFVYSPRVEGIHLRADRIARGGIRWSDRHQDFRTEVLGLMKAQQVKNAVIVPMGAKGGFVVKRPPQEGGRQALLQEGIACYKLFIRGLLDITDNRVGQAIVPPENVLRRDEDDPYLVVAADKGTATFSDIANALSIEYGFWLGDAFASGGSAGYDHKKMGITARGAWESVKRHFRELSHDTQTQPFDVIGVGDMGGDVFGNGMLLSEKIRLVGAFNHVHIFCDPNPDPASSFAERKRLFDGVKGWDEYDQSLLSAGGRIFSRADKSLQLTPEIQQRFDLPHEKVTPAELIQAMLKGRCDLLWFGGIGTYVKATRETHADAGDKSNDTLRVNASDLRARVIGEGANLALTQRSRIELAERGVRLNTDFIDNSAGVDSSDHEVNIKILTSQIMADPKSDMTLDSRNVLLAGMTEDVGRLVLTDNYQQAQAISLMELQAADMLTAHARLIAELEREGKLDRTLECLPDEETIERRLREGKGLTRPELATLQAYAKIWLTSALLASDIPDSAQMQDWCVTYFPPQMQDIFRADILKHGLRREIIATVMACEMVNRLGPTFAYSRAAKNGGDVADVARAYIVVREVFGLTALWSSIEALDGKVPAQVQLKAMRETARMVEREITWFLTRLGRDIDLDADVPAFRGGLTTLKESLSSVLPGPSAEALRQRIQQGMADGLPEAIARDIALMPVLSAACDILRISLDQNTPIPLTAETYFDLGEKFHLDWLRHQARFLPAADRWSAEALEGLTDQLYGCQAGLAVRVMTDMTGACLPESAAGCNMVDQWFSRHGAQSAQIEMLFADLRRAASLDLPMLIIAEQRLRNLYGG